MPMFRKRPVVIEAVRWGGVVTEEIRQFIPESGYYFECGNLVIRTLEDGRDGQAKHVADAGDWIVRGVKGEFYPCKPDIFAATYDPA